MATSKTKAELESEVNDLKAAIRVLQSASMSDGTDENEEVAQVESGSDFQTLVNSINELSRKIDEHTFSINVTIGSNWWFWAVVIAAPIVLIFAKRWFF